MPTPELVRLEAEGLIQRDDDGWRTTPRWQASMMRAALRLIGTEGDGPIDLRVPIAWALVERHGSTVPDRELAALVEAMLPIQRGMVAGPSGP